MILEALIIVVLLVINLIFSVFPTITPPEAIATAFTTATTSLWTLNAFIPIPTIVSAVSILMLTELTILQFKFWKWVVSHIPFIGGR